MKTIKEPERDIPVVHETDICVVGGSCTGVFAAVRAARMGARVAIIEKQNCFGGVATAGAVHIWHSLHDTQGKRPIIGGLTMETVERLKTRDAVKETGGASSAYLLNTEELKIELDELVVESRIKPFLHTLCVAPVSYGGAIGAVIVENKNGRQAIRARQFVDATGDADLCLGLGLQSFQPDTLQPPTTCAKLHGFDTFGDVDWMKAVREHGHEFGLARDWGWGAPIPGLPGIQMRADTHIFGADTSDAEQLTHAEIEGRRQVRAIMDVIRKYGPPGSSIALADLAAMIGTRETRRVVARYRLTGHDVLHGQRFPDAVANGSYRVDIHHAGDSGITFRYLDGTEEVIPERGMPPRRGRWREPLPEDPTFYQIPFRCLVQEQVPNLTLAGRMLDADKVAFSAVRVMVNMNQTGEAAGVACALALEKGQAIQDVDPGLIRKKLADGGSIVA
jgi:glycine/D-amino acid oxidase-like deaminating enzyme